MVFVLVQKFQAEYLPAKIRKGNSMLKILADILAIPMLVFRSNVGKYSPVNKMLSHIQAVLKKRPISAKAVPASLLAEHKQ